jgi:acetyltransferase EpsM
MKEPVVIFGAGGHAKVVVDAILSAKLRPDFLVEDKPERAELFDVRLLASADRLWQTMRQFRFVVAVGDNASRRRIFAELKTRGGVPINVVHPAATVSPRAKLGWGVVVFAGAVINPGATVGDNCIVNTSASIDHECVIGAHAHLCPGVRLAGNVNVGAGTMIGVGAVVLPQITIGEWTTVGAGSMVNRHLPANVVAFGCPAKVRRSFVRKSGE